MGRRGSGKPRRFHFRDDPPRRQSNDPVGDVRQTRGFFGRDENRNTARRESAEHASDVEAGEKVAAQCFVEEESARGADERLRQPETLKERRGETAYATRRVLGERNLTHDTVYLARAITAAEIV